MQSKKLLISMTIILGVALTALAGLLLGMNRLAAPDAMPTAVVAAPTASDVASTASDAASTASDAASTASVIADADTVATINGQIISSAQWNRATRLDTVMSQLAGQPAPSAEETLDRLVNEILALGAVPESPAPTSAEVEARLTALTTVWQISEAELAAALDKNTLSRADLIDRMARLIQVETALNQLAAHGQNVNDWLAQSRAVAEIGLYDALTANSTPAPTTTPTPPAVTLLNPAELAKLPGPDAPPPTPTPLPSQPTAPYEGNLAPDFTLPGLSGDTLSLNDYRGKPILINFWASWCPPCRSELPALQAAYTKYGNDIGFVAVDVKENRDTVAAFIDDMGLTFPVALDAEGQIAQLYEIRGTPTTVFVAADGTVTARHVGPLDEAAIDNYLGPLLEQAVPELPPAPDFSLTAASGDAVALQNYRDRQNVVLVFYRGQT